MTTKTINAEKLSTDNENREQALADELHLVELLKQRPTFLVEHPELLTTIEIPHGTNGVASLIERQVSLLRDKLKQNEKRMNGLLDIARDNDRLADSRHRLALNLMTCRDIEDVVSTVLDELGHELDAEFSVIKLIAADDEQSASHPGLFIDDEDLSAFSTMMKHRNPVCGRSSDEQKQFLFGDNARSVASAAIIPLAAGSTLGLLGLGSTDPQRFHSTMGTDFLRALGELISASVAVHIGR